MRPWSVPSGTTANTVILAGRFFPYKIHDDFVIFSDSEKKL
jgi:hypothetical protein